MGCGSAGSRPKEEEKKGKPKRPSGSKTPHEDKKGRPVPEVKITSDPNPYQEKDTAEPTKEQGLLFLRKCKSKRSEWNWYQSEPIRATEKRKHLQELRLKREDWWG